jgi:hypothetical protein
MSFATRTIAGAATRFSDVTIAIPGDGKATVPDGAFDLHHVGGDEDGWPGTDQLVLPHPLTHYTHVVADEYHESLSILLKGYKAKRPIHVVAPSPTGATGIVPLALLPEPTATADAIGLHVPINPLAATHRHNGLGFTGYLLVLTDRAGTPAVTPPTELAAWLTASFHDLDVVVVEAGSAAVWRGRVLRGVVPVETRTDLWRLIAHARVTIDLRPGAIVARECIESLRFGTPIIVPETSGASAHTHSGAGRTYTSVAELISTIDRLRDAEIFKAMQSEGRRYADLWYGDPDQFVSNLARAFEQVTAA